MELASYWYVLCAYVHVLTVACTQNLTGQNFHCAKNFAKNFSPMACIGKIGKNFSAHVYDTYSFVTVQTI